VNQYGALEDWPPAILGERRDAALLFKKLATLRTDAPLFADVDELSWRGPLESLPSWIERIGDAKLHARVTNLAEKLRTGYGDQRG
jgi:hypothetical protein